MNDVIIVSAVRTPTGKFLGGLKTLAATDLGALVVREAVRRAGIDPASVDECIMGNVVGAGLGQAPARQAALRGGLSDHVAALTINKVCGSGLKAVMLAAQGIAVGDIEIAVAGGMESMSNAPYLLRGARDGLRMGHQELLDSMVTDGLWCSFEQCNMGTAAELVAAEYSVSREAQDEYACSSHRKAAEAMAEGRFTAETLPVEVPQRRAGSGGASPAGPAGRIVVDRDESVRSDTTTQALALFIVSGFPPARE
jgi:acetyl-CoA C-acetyltransferase